MACAFKSGWVLASFPAALLGNGSVALAADAKAAKYYGDAMAHFSLRRLLSF